MTASELYERQKMQARLRELEAERDAAEKRANIFEASQVLVKAHRDSLAALLREAREALARTLQTADVLNEGATRGAGFVEHWGERVMQVAEPLRALLAKLDALEAKP